MMVSLVALELTALSAAVGNVSLWLTLSSRRTVLSGATAIRLPSSIRSSTAALPTVRRVSPFSRTSPALTMRWTPDALTA
jgi:hypothetical protein